MKIAIGNDHTALELKKTVVALLEDRGISVLDTGANTPESFQAGSFGGG